MNNMQFYKSDEFDSLMRNFKSKCEEFGFCVEWINERIGLAFGSETIIIKVGLGAGNIPLYRLDSNDQISTPNLNEFMSQVSSLFFERLEHAY